MLHMRAASSQVLFDAQDFDHSAAVETSARNEARKGGAGQKTKLKGFTKLDTEE